MVNILLIQCSKTHRLRKECPDQSVGIFIRPTLPRMLGKGEVHFHRKTALGFFMFRKLRTVVIRACFSQMFGTMFSELFDGYVAHGFCRSVIHLPTNKIAGFSFDMCGDGLLLALAHNGITLPMAKCFSSVNTRWTRIDHSLVGNGDLLVFLLASAFLSQEEVPSKFSMSIDPGINSLQTYRGSFLFLIPSFRDFIRTPPLP